MTLSKEIPGLAKRITQYLTWDDHGPGEHSDNVGADAWELMEEAAALIQRQAEEIAELKGRAIEPRNWEQVGVEIYQQWRENEKRHGGNINFLMQKIHEAWTL